MDRHRRVRTRGEKRFNLIDRRARNRRQPEELALGAKKRAGRFGRLRSGVDCPDDVIREERVSVNHAIQNIDVPSRYARVR